MAGPMARNPGFPAMSQPRVSHLLAMAHAPPHTVQPQAGHPLATDVQVSLGNVNRASADVQQPPGDYGLRSSHNWWLFAAIEFWGVFSLGNKCLIYMHFFSYEENS